jgi:EAL domain-containing protein (putative c-di-GMP-specific phosphodiesterase class I)
MSAIPAQPSPAVDAADVVAVAAAASASASAPAPAPAHAQNVAGRTPLCFVVDADATIRHFLSLIMHGAGVETEAFSDIHGLPEAFARRTPDAVFLNIALESVEIIECLVKLGERGYKGYVQLMSNRGAAVLGHVKEIGDQNGLVMLPPLKKPFETGLVVKLLQDLKLGDPPEVAGRVDLDEALQKNWIEFWYQPKIDLRKKQLVGAEAAARVRHPTHGMLRPSAFLPGARESSLITLAELALAQALQAGLNLAKLGVNLRLSVNIPVNALTKINVADTVQQFRPRNEKWPGLIIDVREEQIITDLKLASDLSKALDQLNVKLAIDDFGRGYAALLGSKELPFVELKLAKAFVTDCGTEKVNAPLCKTVIDLAHNFGSVAVAVGIEKATDALALVSLGCDYGQGFLLGQPMPEERFISLLRQRATSKTHAAPGAAAPERRRA